MDNATFPKRQDIKTTFTNAGHTLEYLPSYSPDFNDIEPKWAQAKALRKREGCSIEQLFAACACSNILYGISYITILLLLILEYGRYTETI
jgi:transposase